METIAVYWESRVKTYGFQITPNVCLVEVVIPGSRLSDFGRALLDFSKGRKKFLLILTGPADDDRIQINLALHQKDEKDFLNVASETSWFNNQSGKVATRASEILHFQGPHYGDRYGIADSAFRALEKGGLAPLAATCAGHSIQIVLPPGQAENAVFLLCEPFDAPQSSKMVERKQ